MSAHPPGSIEARMEAAMAHQGAGRLAEAAAIYENIVAEDPRQVNARHNLGMARLHLGLLAGAVEMLEVAWAQDGANSGWQQSLPMIGLALFDRLHWEEAQPWLARAAMAGCGEPRVYEALERIAPRDYLAPEVFDARLGRTLLRYSPRESPTYVYAIDISGTCNLKCPTCPVGNSPVGGRAKGFMDVDLFRRIVEKIVAEKAADRPEIFLFNWGEPLLHPQLAEILGIIHAAGLPSHLSTNLNIDRGLREMAKANPTNLKISLSGFTPETYERSHAGGNLALVKSNLYRVRHELDKAKATTRVWVGHHLYRHNLHQQEEVAAACRELRFDHHPIVAFFQPLERLIEVAEGRGAPHPILDELLDHPRDYVPRLRDGRRPGMDCELRFNQTAINFDGTVALCCSVYEEANMLGAHFLEKSHTELEAMKYAHPFCETCMKAGVQYSPARLPEKAPGA